MKLITREDINQEFISSNKSIINNLLRSINRPGIEDLIKYLNTSSFYSDPASSKYHSNHIGGLAYHSLGIYHILRHLVSLHNLTIPDETLIISSILHDLCKVDTYQLTYSYYKDPSDQWVKYPSYQYKEPQHNINLPHGQTSVQIIQQYIPLNIQEIEAISWHMGAYDEGNSNKSSMNKSYKSNPLSLLLHHSDMQHAYFYEPTFDRYSIPDPISILTL